MFLQTCLLELKKFGDVCTKKEIMRYFDWCQLCIFQESAVDFQEIEEALVLIKVWMHLSDTVFPIVPTMSCVCVSGFDSLWQRAKARNVGLLIFSYWLIYLNDLVLANLFYCSYWVLSPFHYSKGRKNTARTWISWRKLMMKLAKVSCSRLENLWYSTIVDFVLFVIYCFGVCCMLGLNLFCFFSHAKLWLVQPMYTHTYTVPT